MNICILKEGEEAIVTSVNLHYEARKKLLTFGLGLGAKVFKNYSPGFTGLYNITINGKYIALRKRDALKIEVEKI